eukprot:4383370-Alexandrium_andersonii.AAC.1
MGGAAGPRRDRRGCPSAGSSGWLVSRPPGGGRHQASSVFHFRHRPGRRDQGLRSAVGLGSLRFLQPLGPR